MIPKISITIPKDSGSITVTDITGDYPTDSTGYGIAVYLPQNNLSWFKQLYVQFLGDASGTKLTFFPSDANEDVSATISYTFKDGIWLITEYFTRSVSGIDYAIDTPKTTLTKGAGAETWIDPAGLFEGVYGLIVSASEAFDIDDVSPITTFDATTVTLESALTSGVDDGPLWFVYRVQKYVLITNDGEGDLISDIGDMAINSLANGQGCDNDTAIKLFNRVLLKLSATISMNCGNYAKAHNAAVLLSETSTSSPTCTTC